MDLRTRTLPLYLISIALAAVLAACGDDDDSTDSAPLPQYDYSVPLDPESPWPKFRRNALQNGRSPIEPVDSGRAPWVFQTGKGIFSAPVIDGRGNVYIGSADQTFYALDRDGRPLWSFPTGEIIDSSALLDDAGRVIFGSGDGFVYALDRADGRELWRFEAEDPSVNGAFINWFEGNVAIGADGTLFVPNDNFCTYGLSREDGSPRWCFETLDQTWSLPAYNPTTDRLFIGNNFYFSDNTFALDAATGDQVWKASVNGSVAASPLLTSADPDELAVVGSFDGFLRGYRQSDGAEVWIRGVRDHIYASPAQMADGTIVQPSADGTVYAVRPEDGSVVWAFDTIEPIRSSPAIDAAGNIYVGSGEGRLFVLNPDGSLHWSIKLIDDSRDDLNSSPALGPYGVVIAGENGGVFGVPYEYCLRPGLSDDRCTIGPGESLPDSGTFLFYTSRFGRLQPEAPERIDANQSLTFSLTVREAGDTVLAVLDSSSVEVTIEPAAEVLAAVSGDRKFLTVIPRTGFAPGEMSIRMRGDYLVDLEREGLRFLGGRVGGSFDQTLRFEVEGPSDSELPLPVPAQPGDPAGVWQLFRLAAPLPTILPSYNQIGFDSIHYLVGLVEGSGDRAIAWAIGGRLSEDGEGTVIEPTSRVRFPFEVRHDGGLLTMINEDGFAIEFNGFPIPFDFFRAATRIDDQGNAIESPALNAKVICGDIDFYGPFLQFLGYCNPDSDLLEAAGAAELRLQGSGVVTAPDGVGEVRFSSDGQSVIATFEGTALQVAEHNLGILLVDTATGGAVGLDYTRSTVVEANADGTVRSVELTLPEDTALGTVRAYAMVDTYPAAVEILEPR